MPGKILAWAGLAWIASLGIASAAAVGTSAQGSPLDITLPMSAETFARLARSNEFYRSTRASTKLSQQQVVELGDWVPWEFQHETDEAPLPSEDSEEVVPSPPSGLAKSAASLSHVKGGGLTGELGGGKGPEGASGRREANDQQQPQIFHKMRHMYAAVTSPARFPHAGGGGGGCGGGGGGGGGAHSAVVSARGFFANVAARQTGPFLRPLQRNHQDGRGNAQQMYRKIRLRYAVSSPLGASHNDGSQGHTLREGDDEVIYTETDCISGLPMFRGDLVVKTTYRVTRSEDDPDNSVRVKVSVVVRDLKLARAVGWLSKRMQRGIKESGKKQAEKTLRQMVEAQGAPGL